MLATVSLAAATIAMGLAAGLFFSFSVAVMPGLRRAGDAAFVEVMHHINTAILNVWFALAFGGAIVLSVLALVAHLVRDASSPAVPWIAAAVAAYLVCLIITGRANIPLNNAIDRAGPTPADAAGVRTAFEAGWVRWNHARTATSTAALAALVVALVVG
ncbi:DUF1772 domain-containing protein [Occultella glacieicola]|uniref:DUF1772 domain-containing protein n=1 Tax=Occultella glacieicola TaxID=2518684 RepID=A0ABY2E4P9_9MICO|nr:anthrone oxygenase family protein [Occultella glacieicola]TDE94991.1 DUF1772 domain-containing protein [Occultella glacieicola]